MRLARWLLAISSQGCLYQEVEMLAGTEGLDRQQTILTLIGVFYAVVPIIYQVLFAPQIPFTVNILLTVLIVAVVGSLLVAAFGMNWLARSRALANFYRRPLAVILLFGAVDVGTLYLLHYSSYLYGLDVLAEQNNVNVTEVFHVPLTGAQLHDTLEFAIVEAFAGVIVLTFLIGYILYMMGMDRQRVLQHQ